MCDSSKQVSVLQKQCQAILPAVQAAAEGKAIQYRCGSFDEWKDAEGGGRLGFYASNEYRVKPEPQYRPLTPTTAVTLLGSWVRGDDERSYDIVAIEETGVRFAGREFITYDRLLENFRTSCGARCGLLVES